MSQWIRFYYTFYYGFYEEPVREEKYFTPSWDSAHDPHAQKSLPQFPQFSETQANLSGKKQTGTQIIHARRRLHRNFSVTHVKSSCRGKVVAAPSFVKGKESRSADTQLLAFAARCLLKNHLFPMNILHAADEIFSNAGRFFFLGRSGCCDVEWTIYSFWVPA